MKRRMRLVQRFALVAVFLCVLVPPALAQECPELIGSLYNWCTYRAIAVSGDHTYVGRESCYHSPVPIGMGLDVFNVSDPSAPTVVGSIDLDVDWIAGIAVLGDHLYVRVSPAGIHIVDVSEPSAPELVGYMDGQNLYGSAKIVASGPYLYVMYADGLRIMDVSTPSAPVEVGFLAGVFGDLAVSDGFAYISSGDDFHVVDIRDPPTPTLVGYTLLPNVAWGTVAAGGRVYGTGICINDTAVLQIIDVSNPELPFPAGQTNHTPCGHLAASGDYLYHSHNINFDGCQGNHLDVYDVSDASAPVLVSTVEGTAGGGVAVSDGFVYGARRPCWNLPVNEEGGLDVFRDCAPLFSDGFESGDCSAWSAVVP